MVLCCVEPRPKSRLGGFREEVYTILMDMYLSTVCTIIHVQYRLSASLVILYIPERRHGSTRVPGHGFLA
jgi:hypothetical protein